MGTGHSFWKNDIAQGYNINQLKSNGSTDDKSNSTKPWSLICKLNDTPRGGRTVPSHCQKTDEWVVPRWLGWPSHSLACEITQLKKTSHTTFHGPCTLLCDGPHPVECASLWIPTNTPLTYLCVSNWIFAVRHQSLSFIRSWSQASWVLARLKSWERGAEGHGGKSSVKNVPRTPLHNLPENLLNTWPVLTVFFGLILGTKKIKDRRTPTRLGNSYWGPADSGAFGTHWGVAPTESSIALTAACLFAGGSRKQGTRDCTASKILLAICPSNHRNEDILP